MVRFESPVHTRPHPVLWPNSPCISISLNPCWHPCCIYPECYSIMITSKPHGVAGSPLFWPIRCLTAEKTGSAAHGGHGPWDKGGQRQLPAWGCSTDRTPPTPSSRAAGHLHVPSVGLETGLMNTVPRLRRGPHCTLLLVPERASWRPWNWLTLAAAPDPCIHYQQAQPTCCQGLSMLATGLEIGPSCLLLLAYTHSIRGMDSRPNLPATGTWGCHLGMWALTCLASDF